MIELGTRRQVSLLVNRYKIHYVDYFSVVSLIDVKHDRGARFNSLTLFVQNHMPDRETTLLVAYGQVNLLVSTVDDFFYLLYCNMRVYRDRALVLSKVPLHDKLDISKM